MNADVDSHELPPDVDDKDDLDTNRRQIALRVHAYLRDRIVEGDIRPNEILSQAQIARQFGVSRAPVREAFSRLHAQGLIVAEANQRSRVATFDPGTLDSLYGLRVLTEALGAKVTCGAVTPELVAQLRDQLRILMTTDGSTPAWRDAHRAFHATVVAGAGEIVQLQTIALQERSEPYFRLYQGVSDVAGSEHEGIVEAFEAGDPVLAMRRHGRHVAQSGLSVLTRMAPEYEPVTIRASLHIIGSGEG